MPSTDSLTRRVGQRVLLSGGKFHGAARITKVNPKNLVVTMEGTRQLVNAHPSFLSDLADDAPVPSRFDAMAEVMTAPPLHPGAVVRIKGHAGKWVVLADKLEKVNVARLGGDGGRYLRALRRQVEPLSEQEVAALTLD